MGNQKIWLSGLWSIVFLRCSCKQPLSSLGFQTEAQMYFIEHLSFFFFLCLTERYPCFTVSSWHILSMLISFKKSLPIVEARCSWTAVFCSSYHSVGWTIQRAIPTNSAVSTSRVVKDVMKCCICDVPESGIVLWQSVCHPMALGFEMVLQTYCHWGSLNL